MNPAKVNRERLTHLTDLPNVGKATASDLQILGINTPDDLKGRSPDEMYETLCQMTGKRHDPCVIDVFASIVDFMNGNPAQPWWKYSSNRKNPHS